MIHHTWYPKKKNEKICTITDCNRRYDIKYRTQCLDNETHIKTNDYYESNVCSSGNQIKKKKTNKNPVVLAFNDFWDTWNFSRYFRMISRPVFCRLPGKISVIITVVRWVDFPGNRFLFTRVPCIFYVRRNLMAKTTAG